MIINYNNGKEFILDNKLVLDTNKYLAVFFNIDARILNEVDKKNYAIKVIKNEDVLLAIKVMPYNLLLFGSKNCINELFNYLNENNYEYGTIICETCVGDELIHHHSYQLMIGMDFMECREKTKETSKKVLTATIDDLDELYQLSFDFFKDCGLPDIPNKEKMATYITRFKVIKENGHIVSMASYAEDTDNSYRLTHVYTKPEARGKGYARLVCNAIKNEILDLGKVATLNVDQKNPISYHLYLSLGFKKLFSQGIYIKGDK